MNTMKKLTMATLIAVATMGTATVATTAPAAAREAFVFSFDTGNVAFAYSDGYYDHDRRWHRWHNIAMVRVAAIRTAAGMTPTVTVCQIVTTATAMVTACRTASTIARTTPIVVNRAQS